MNIAECLVVVDAWIAAKKQTHENVGLTPDEFSASARAMAAAVLYESHKAVGPAKIATIAIPQNSDCRRAVVRCPFHWEKTPSCAVDIVRNSFHCFSCGAGGQARSGENGTWELDRDRTGFT